MLFGVTQCYVVKVTDSIIKETAIVNTKVDLFLKPFYVHMYSYFRVLQSAE
jgi:hypothetical protein